MTTLLYGCCNCACQSYKNTKLDFCTAKNSAKNYAFDKTCKLFVCCINNNIFYISDAVTPKQDCVVAAFLWKSTAVSRQQHSSSIFQRVSNKCLWLCEISNELKEHLLTTNNRWEYFLTVLYFCFKMILW